MRKLLDEYELSVRYVYFPLHPETPDEGRRLDELFADRLDMYENMRSRLIGFMAEEGLEYGDRTHTYNSRYAQELAKWAESQEGGAGEAIHALLYEAYFVDGLNIGDPAVLLALVERAGLGVGVARVVLEERTFAKAVDADWVLSRQYGVTGVPTYVADGRGVVGAQEYAVLEQLVQAGGAPVRSA